MIFIVGMSRTGTTLMARSLSKGSGMCFLNETHFMREYQPYFSSDSLFESENFTTKFINQFITIQRKDYYRKSEYQEYPDAVRKVNEQFNRKEKKNFAALLRCLFEYEANQKGKKYAGDQTPNHIFFIDKILKYFPEAKFINMIRDPRAVVLSQKNKWKASKRLNQPLFEIIRAKINYHPITQSILWKKAVNSGNAAFHRYGEKKIKRVFYEQFVTEPKEHLQAICDFIGTEYDETMLETSVSMSSNVTSEKKSIGFDSSLIDKWKTMLSSSEIFLVEIICGKDAAEFGYKMSGKKPNYLSLLIYIIIFPFHVILAYLLSANRFKNPFKSLKQMVFKTS